MSTPTPEFINPFDPKLVATQYTEKQIAILKAIGERNKTFNKSDAALKALAPRKSDGSPDINALYDDVIEATLQAQMNLTKRLLTIDVSKCDKATAEFIKTFRQKEGKELSELSEAGLRQHTINDQFLGLFSTAEDPELPAELKMAADFDMMRALLRKGADINYADKANLDMTALRWSIELENMAFFNFLLENKANPATVAENGMTPLMHAAQKNNKDMVLGLMKAGADPKQTTKRGPGVNLPAGLKRVMNVRNLQACLFTTSPEINKALLDAMGYVFIQAPAPYLPSGGLSCAASATTPVSAVAAPGAPSAVSASLSADKSSAATQRFL